MKTAKIKLYRFLSLVLIALFAVGFIPYDNIRAVSKETVDTALVETEIVSSSVKPKKVVTFTDIPYINKYGNAYLGITCDDFKALGYEYGDIVKVKILGKKFKMPFVKNFTDVASESLCLVARDEDEYIGIALTMSDFVTDKGIATKKVNEDGNIEWSFPDGVSGPVKVSIWMKEKAGYLDGYDQHQITRTNNREDYAELTDEEFANFRMITTTGMGYGRIYRTSSPVDPLLGRNTYADTALKNAGVTVVMNLTDTDEKIKNYEGFEDSYYSGLKYITLNLPVDFKSDNFTDSLSKGFKFLAANPGVYAFHCTEGKDRAGFTAAILECLMGASYDEVVSDYMVTYYNYYGIKPGEARYETYINENIAKILKEAFTFKKSDKKKDLKTRNLSKCAAKYLTKLGLTKTEIEALKKNLGADLGNDNYGTEGDKMFEKLPKGKWYDKNGNTMLEFDGKKMYATWWSGMETPEVFKIKIIKEYDDFYIKCVDGEYGESFGIMSRLKIEDDGTLTAYEEILDGESHRYKFVPEDKIEAEKAVKDYSEDMPKIIESDKIVGFSLVLQHYFVEDLGSGTYSWEIRKNNDGRYISKFSGMGSSYVIIQDTREVDDPFIKGLVELIKKEKVSENNGLFFSHDEDNVEYSLYIRYENREKISIRVGSKALDKWPIDNEKFIEYAMKFLH